MTPHVSRLLAAGLCIAAPAAALAQHETDIVLKVDRGQIVTGAVEQGAAVFPRQVFTSVLGVYGIPGATFDPGFDSETGALPPNSIIGLSVRRALRKWDGQMFSITPEQQIEIIRSQTLITPPADPLDCGIAGSLALGLTSPTGRLHQHPAYQLTPPLSPGIYMVELEAWVSDPEQAVSEPFFILFSQDESPAVLLEAAQWVEDNLSRSCYANCTRSKTPLSVADFICFIDKFAVGDCYANCTRSTGPQAFNVNDFLCFIDKFAQGCP